ncbi:MAG: aspartate aminotransferase family protein [Chloroflexi bacterium]|nr:aspartate aminotransferase family protein [Chloroflexota bacterium]
MSAPNLNRQRSRELMERSRRVVAGGISSQIRLNEPGGEPLFFDRSEGALMWDADGNEYIDYIQGMGPNIFGHAPEFVSNQVSEDMRKGYVFAAQFERELEVAEMAADAVPIEDCTVRFASSGTEIDQLALRLARGYTGRTKYIRFEGHYHGWMDSVNHSVHPPIDEAGNVESPNVVGESAGMDPGAASQVIPCQWNDPDRLEAAFDRNPGQVAAVIMEPINANTNCIMPEPGYLEAVNEIAHRHGALVIFDEVITGFRVAYGGAQELLGITPDLATYAKSIAAGFPIAMLAGRRDIMDILGSGEVYHGGSFNSNVMSISAAYATLNHLKSEGDAFYADLNRRGQRLIEGLRHVAMETETDIHIQGLGSVFGISFNRSGDTIRNYRDHATKCDDARYIQFASEMMREGVRLSSNGRVHMSSAHTDEQVDQTIQAAGQALSRI